MRKLNVKGFFYILILNWADFKSCILLNRVELCVNTVHWVP